MTNAEAGPTEFKALPRSLREIPPPLSAKVLRMFWSETEAKSRQFNSLSFFTRPSRAEGCQGCEVEVEVHPSLAHTTHLRPNSRSLPPAVPSKYKSE